MKTKDIEECLHISKENLRYYEKEGLIHPQRKNNGYREYSGEDIGKLKKILVMRKLGITIAEIRDVLEDRRTLGSVLDDTMVRLNSEIEAMKAAYTMCGRLVEENTTISSLDADACLEKINEEQKKGGRFADLTKDILADSAELLTDSFGHFQFFFPVFKPVFNRRKGSKTIAVIMVILFLIGGGKACQNLSMRNNMPDRPYFWIGFCTFGLFLILWLIAQNLILHLSEKHPSHKKRILRAGSVLCALLFIGLDICAALHWSRLLMLKKNNEGPVFLAQQASFIQVLRDDEIGNPDNDFTQSHQSMYYYAADPAYIAAFETAVNNCVPTGVWSVTRNDFTLYHSKKLLEKAGKDPGHFWQLLWNGKAEGDTYDRYTIFYLYYDEQSGWLLDEPSYGTYYAGTDLIDLVQHYDEHIQFKTEWKDSLKRIFEYDPETVYPGSYADGRFDYYEYLTLKDKETGEDITEEFIRKWMPDYREENWEALVTALQQVQEIWRTEYVHPEDAHMES